MQVRPPASFTVGAGQGSLPRDEQGEEDEGAADEGDNGATMRALAWAKEEKERDSRDHKRDDRSPTPDGEDSKGQSSRSAPSEEERSERSGGRSGVERALAARSNSDRFVLDPGFSMLGP